MSQDYLTGLANQIQDQYGLGETQTNALNIMNQGHNRKGQTLGDFSQKFDTTQGRRYLEEGYLRYDPWNVAPKAMEILMQEPDITLLVKKRAFSTLAENHRLDYMDSDEKLFYKASKILFQNKCRQIAALEKLSKIERISTATGQLDSQLLPIIITLVDQLSPGYSNSPLAEENDFTDTQASEPFKKLTGVLDKIRQVYAFSDFNNYTTWITDTTNLFKTDFSQGTGVIEITNLISLNSTTAVQPLAGGSLSFSVVDPYKSMTVTNSDIEWAILDAINMFNNSPIFQLGKDSIDKVAAQNIKLLNDARTARGAGTIEFQVNPDTDVDNQVVAIIENIGELVHFTHSLLPDPNNLFAGGVNVSVDSLIGGPLVQQDGLDPKTEVPIFSAAVSAMYNSIQFKKTSQTNMAQNSTLTNYVRQKLRFHYGKKPIIQIMDQVHLYISTKSHLDNKISVGLQNSFTALGYLQNLNNQIFDLKNQFTTLFNPAANIDLQMEKSIYVGANFPTALWVLMRNMFINEKSGCHVFAGVVEGARRNFSEGKWIVSVTCKDNAAYLDYSVVNLNPGVDQFNGPLYDPLTPFETRFDAVSSNYNREAPKLLPENQALMNAQNNIKGLAKYNSGRNAGSPVTLNNFFGDKELSGNGISRNVYYAPNGLVYKWKEGIGVLVQFGDSFNNDNLQTIGIPSETSNPLAGQDIMNVLSLYITGVPYNYGTYYQSVKDFDTFGRNPQSGSSGAKSFYTSLTNDLKKRNLQWGDFIPFKNLVVDEQTYVKMLDSKLTIQNTNAQVDTLLQQIQDAQTKLTLLQKGGDSTSSAVSSLTSEVSKLQAQLKTQTDIIQSALQNSNNKVKIIGSDVSFDPDQSQTSQSFSLSDPTARREIRRTTNFLTRRVSWQVRANDDKSLFIVDDSYDKDYDITAFEIDLVSKLSQYTTEYSTVKDKIISVAQLLNLEVFCDSQGHIRARSPQYNRMPSSVFYRMMQLKQQTGIQVFPQFLDDLFSNNVRSLLTGLKVIEDQIRLDGAILGKKTDIDVINFINGQQGNSNFQFISPDDDGTTLDVTTLINNSTPETSSSNQNNTFLDALKAQNSVTSVFNTQTRAQAVESILGVTTSGGSITTTLNSNRINDLQQRLFKETGKQVQLDNFTVNQDNSVLAIPKNTVDAFKITKDLADKISARQKIIQQATSAVKNAQEVKSLDANSGNTANSLLFPNLYGNQNVPEIFEHMIEDESYDDYGPNSGSRYIIHNYQIKSIDISENKPDFTMIEVSGLLDPLLGKNSLPSGLNSFPDQGNGLVTAAAVDYDLWRMYGWKAATPIQVPFLSNPQTQCGPYVASLLSRARRNIMRAEVVIVGNEFMQPGEVVYIEDEDLLFYVESVHHNINVGSSFTTSLSLSYGHNPGEYIPTSLDVIGKMLYNTTATLNANYANYRQSNVFNESPLGSILINAGQSDLTGITGGTFGGFNSKIISNILYVASAALTQNNVLGSNVQPVVELRLFYDSKSGAVSGDLMKQATNLQSILTGPTSLDTKHPNTKMDRALPNANVIVTTVDVADTNQYRSPSQSAWDLARNAANNSTTGTASTTDIAKVTQTIYSLLIDCVMTFSNVTSTASSSPATATSTTTQAGTSSTTSNAVSSTVTEAANSVSTVNANSVSPSSSDNIGPGF